MSFGRSPHPVTSRIDLDPWVIRPEATVLEHAVVEPSRDLGVVASFGATAPRVVVGNARLNSGVVLRRRDILDVIDEGQAPNRVDVAIDRVDRRIVPAPVLDLEEAVD